MINPAPTGTLLVVDDQPANFGVLFDYFTAADFKVLVAQDGKSAVSQARRAQPEANDSTKVFMVIAASVPDATA